ncbi:MAG: hypothetical protein ABR860_05130 [Terracidiphilus sp.]|jgi:hypothetical protein
MKEPSESAPPAGRDTAICTLFEGDYHLGLAALVNSLVRAGYAGTVWAGYRGALPPWVNQLKRGDKSRADEFRVTDQVRIVFMKLSTGMHLTNYKPEFMLNLLANEARDCKYLWYFDPDIFVQAPWSIFADWQSYGIALCQEIVDNIFPADAPLRQQWMKLAAGIGFTDPRPVNHYYNGGMVGVSSANAEFLEAWKRLINLAGSLGYDLRYQGLGSREMPFNMSDQDALNIAIMYTKFPLTTLGPQGMGFIYGASMMMYHAVGQKPWRGSFLLRALRGMPPSGAMKFFLTQVVSPIRAYSPMHLRAKRLACAISAFIGRFYRRT